MNDLNDMMPGPSDRPDVPEFWQLSEIVLGLDGNAQEGKDIVATIEEIIPEDVAGYMALQRAKRAVLSGDLMMTIAYAMKDPEVMKLLASHGASWLDGFIAGANYAKKYPKVEKT